MDAGTTSCRTILFDKSRNVVNVAQKEFTQLYPRQGWVEHDAEEIWEVQLSVAREALIKANATASDIAALGITNQRETTVVWNKDTGKPIYNAIVWQCRRTAEYCESLVNAGMGDIIRQKTGLVVDAYFSASKLKWILDNIRGAKEAANAGKLLFGTIETWLIWKLTGGKVHITDYSNASRTMMFNINTLTWDEDILRELDIPKQMLPEAMPSSCAYGETLKEFFGSPIKIAGAAGDQQSALFGHACFERGNIKNTYGTGCFMLMNTGNAPIFTDSGLVATIAWGIDGRVDYALEGSVFVAGAAIQWLRDELGLIKTASESEELASKVDDTNGCVFAPAFTGLGAPYWDAYARGTIVGLTRGVNKNHIVRATLESIAYEVNDVLDIMENVSGIKTTSISVDGGASANNLLMQMQADISNRLIKRPVNVERTAVGAAFLAGLAVGYWESMDEIANSAEPNKLFAPNMTDDIRTHKIKLWRKAVARSLDWAKGVDE